MGCAEGAPDCQLGSSDGACHVESAAGLRRRDSKLCRSCHAPNHVQPPAAPLNPGLQDWQAVVTRSRGISPHLPSAATTKHPLAARLERRNTRDVPDRDLDSSRTLHPSHLPQAHPIHCPSSLPAHHSASCVALLPTSCRLSPQLKHAAYLVCKTLCLTPSAAKDDVLCATCVGCCCCCSRLQLMTTCIAYNNALPCLLS